MYPFRCGGRTLPGYVPSAKINPAGCSGEQLVDDECLCNGSRKNHGGYVTCVAHAAEDYLLDRCAAARRATARCNEASARAGFFLSLPPHPLPPDSSDFPPFSSGSSPSSCT